jgi:hypothetical protein
VNQDKRFQKYGKGVFKFCGKAAASMVDSAVPSNIDVGNFDRLAKLSIKKAACEIRSDAAPVLPQG